MEHNCAYTKTFGNVHKAQLQRQRLKWAVCRLQKIAKSRIFWADEHSTRGSGHYLTWVSSVVAPLTQHNHH